ncbi:TonB-dependent receptor plug domain-containing protein [Uliginosibacterium sp. H3]|uniref:TonB-dependent receptor plug domain-containing protein n=1 Tax=Uliginosibacterium silvisoli TaxID=3114758 RepID=A0ABU6K0T7_9RHOO|nr:TonB-dependent receptor plug domain-containing protein [Uliginosibacterium sp. H3]
MPALLIQRAPVSRLPPRLALLGGLLLAASQAMASAESTYLADMPVVLSASRMPQPLNEAPGAVTVISGDFIRSTGYRDLARVFRLVPGMQIGQERGNNHWVTYHGLGSTFPSELQVLVDGRSIYSPSSFGGVDWSALPVSIDEIDRVEVVRGPNAVSYGANAFMGVINIITRHSLQEPINLARLTGGNADIHDLDLMTHAAAGALSTRINVSSHNDDGFANLNDARRVDLLSTRTDWRLGNADELTLRLSLSSGSKGEGYPKSLFASNAERKSTSDAQALHLTWTHAPSAGEETLLHYYHNRENVTDGWTAIIPSPFPYGPTTSDLERNRRATRDHLEFQRRSSNEQRQTVWGAEVRRDSVEAPYVFSGGKLPPADMYRAFANLDEHLSRNWQLNLGASLEHFSDQPTHFAPRLFINTQLDAQQTLRAGVSRAWQQRPTFEENVDVRVIDPKTGALLVHAYQPNPDLRQSRIDSAELGYLGRFKTLDSSLDVRLFNERVKDYVVRVAQTSNAALTPWIGSSQYVNLSYPITLRGIEYQFKFKPVDSSQILFSHTLIDRHSGNENIDARIAPYTASLSWQQQWGHGWSSTLTGIRMGSLSGGDGFVPVSSYTAKPYTSFDARVAWLTTLGAGKKLELALNAINLGERHQEIPDRAEQRYLSALGNDTPANYVSRMIYLTASLAF